MTEFDFKNKVSRVRPDFFYVMIFILAGIIFYGAQNIFDMFVKVESKIYIYTISILFPFLAAVIAKIVFLKTEKRGMVKREASRLSLKSYAIFLILHIVFTAILFFGGAIAEEGSIGLDAFAVLFSIFFFIILAFLFVSIFQFIAIYLGFKLIGLNKSNAKDTPLFDQSGQAAINDDAEGFGSDAFTPENNVPVETPVETPVESKDSWVAPHERGGFAVREERAPWLKWTVSLLALLIVGGGAAWLTSKVVISDELPVIEKAEKIVDEKEDTPPPKSADDEAWVKALEIDTVKGYRDYLEALTVSISNALTHASSSADFGGGVSSFSSTIFSAFSMTGSSSEITTFDVSHAAPPPTIRRASKLTVHFNQGARSSRTANPPRSCGATQLSLDSTMVST